jgi:hypothetical protein
MDSVIPPINIRNELAKLIWSLKEEVELGIRTGDNSTQELWSWFPDELGPNSPDLVVVQNQQYLKECFGRVCTCGFEQFRKIPRAVMRGKIEVELIDTPSSVGVTSRTCRPLTIHRSFIITRLLISEKPPAATMHDLPTTPGQKNSMRNSTFQPATHHSPIMKHANDAHSAGGDASQHTTNEALGGVDHNANDEDLKVRTKPI